MEYNVLSHVYSLDLAFFLSVEALAKSHCPHQRPPSVGRVICRRASIVAKFYRLTTIDISLCSTLFFACNHPQFGLVYELQTHCNVASWIFKYSLIIC